MRFLDRALGVFGLQVKSSNNVRSEDLLAMLDAGGFATSGTFVNTTTAMRLSAVNACVKIISESIGQLPLITYRRLPGGGRERAPNHPTYRLLKLQPNHLQTSMEWRELMMNHATLDGNSYFRKAKVDGVIDELLPFHPRSVEPRLTPGGDLFYRVTPTSSTQFGANQVGKPRDVPAEDIFHVRGHPKDAISGRSVLGDARDAFGAAMASERYGALLWRNGARPSGVLTAPNALKPDSGKRMLKSWNDVYGSVENFNKTALLEEGVEYKSISITPEDAQFLETRKFQIAEVARYFRVPLHKIGELDRSTNNNIEKQALEFVVDTLTPWLVRIEMALQRDIFEGDDEFFAEFNLDGLLRGDSISRWKTYKIAIETGIMNADEIRAKENMNEQPDGQGKKFMQPLNMGDRRQGLDREDEDE